MPGKPHNLFWGVLLIVLGGIFLAGNLSPMGMETLWPIFPLAIGLAFIVGYFKNRNNYGLLMPGSILIVVGLLFFYCNFFGWWHMEDAWPIFIMAPAVGFIAMYYGGPREDGLLVPATILFGLGLIFFLVNSGFGDYWPVLLIIAGGAMILFKGLPKMQSQSSEPDKPDEK